MPSHLRSFLPAGAAVLLGVSLAAATARADTLSWGSLNPTYAPTGAQAIQKTNLASINGNTVSIQFGNNSFFSTAYASPAVGAYGNAGTVGTNTTCAGGGTGKAALQILSDFDNSAGNIIAGGSSPVTIFFDQSVPNPMFSFYDVDNGSTGSGVFNDRITNLFGLGTGGAATPPISITNGAASASVTAMGNSGQGIGDGHLALAFGNTPVARFSFHRTDTSLAAGGSKPSAIRVFAPADRMFTTVPESSALALFGLGGAMGIFTARTLRSARRSRHDTVDRLKSLELADPPEFPVTCVKVRVAQRAQPLQAERLDVEAGDHAAADHRFSQRVEPDLRLVLPSQFPNQAAREAVAGAGRVE